MSLFDALLSVLTGLSLFGFFVGCGCVLFGLGGHGRRKYGPSTVGVTVLKPLKGIDAGLYDNLKAIVLQDHEAMEIVFGCEDVHDPALDVAERLAREYPERAIKIVRGGAKPGVNPKVRILRAMLEEATHEWVLISDSNVRPRSTYVRNLLGVQARSSADLVHSLLSSAEGESTGARLEELHLCGWVASAISLASMFGHPCVIGKSMLLRCEVLKSEFALPEVHDVLAEDYILGARLSNRGEKVILSPDPLPVVTGGGGISKFFERHVRWGQMRRRIAPGFFLGEVFANPTPFLLALVFFSPEPLQRWGLFFLSAKWALDGLLYVALAERPSMRTLVLAPMKDLLVPIMWAISGVKRTVQWRGNRMLVSEGSRLTPLPPQAQTVRSPIG